MKTIKLQFQPENIPVFGGLFAARKEDRWEAFWEVSIGVVLSTIPIWLGLLLVYFLQENQSFITALRKNIEVGEFFMYSASVLAPMSYFLYHENRDYKRPMRSIRVISFMCLISWIVCIGGFTIVRIQKLTDVEMRLNIDAITFASLYLYGFSILICFIATVNKNARSGAAAYQEARQTQNFVNSYNESKDTE